MMVNCADITPAKPGFLPSNCCVSCHEDEDEGYDDLWWEPFLHCCCAQLRVLDEAGIDIHDEQALTEWTRSSQVEVTDWEVDEA